MKTVIRIINSLLLFACADVYYFLNKSGDWWWLAILIPVYVLVNIFPAWGRPNRPGIRLKICSHGCECLIIFLASTILAGMFHFVLALFLLPGDWKILLTSILIAFAVEALLFWNGIICVYCTSIQLGVHHRIVGIVCGWIPIVHIIALCSIIGVVSREVEIETEKCRLNEKRIGQEVCVTKYPILLVHGVFFRDFKYLNYWGRVPDELVRNGATIFYGNHQSAASVPESAKELAERIRQIIRETNCEKVNIIAHSKGGLDCRYALAHYGIESMVASLTTINTPHRGCEFAEYLLHKVPVSTKNKIAGAYNTALKKLGDFQPDFISAVTDLTATRCRELDTQMLMPEGVFCQSFGSKLNHATGGKFPLNFSYLLVKHFDGPNDGLVSENSFRWGEEYHLISVRGRRGVSHGDMIDLNRENIEGFDVREFYVKLVEELKIRGV